MTRRRSKQPATPSPQPSPSSPSSLTDLVLSHFDRHQRGVSGVAEGVPDSEGGVLDTRSRATRLRDDISSELLNRYVAVAASLEDEHAKSSTLEIVEAAREEIIKAVILCVDVSLEAVASAKGATGMNAIEESVEATLDLVAAFACGRGDGTIGAAVISRAVTLSSKVQSDTIRSKACDLLGMCVSYALGSESSNKRDLGGKKKRRSKGKRRDDITSFIYGLEIAQANGKLEPWRVECINDSGAALLPRLTDKSQAVRLSAVKACRAFFQHNGIFDEIPNEDLLKALLAQLTHDSSFKCRSAAALAVPVTKETLPLLLERVGDVKTKVRVYVLEAIRSKVDFAEDLSEEQRVDILRSGLTERCPETNRATVEMLCCGWMKAVKFDPIDFLRLLDPVANEEICEKAVRAIIAASNDDENDMLKDLSDPEIRAYKEGMDKKVSVDATADEEPILDPAAALYLRVLCDETEASTSLSPSEKANALGKLLPDIPALGQTMKKHLDRLVTSMRSDEDHSDGEDSNEDTIATEDAECFICSQLLKMARRSSDLQEEGSRRHFVSLMCEMLGSIKTPEDLLEGCVMALHAAHDMDARFLQTVSEIVSNVGDDETMSDESADMDTSALEQVRVVSILSLALEAVSTYVGTSRNTAVLDSLSAHIVPAVTSPNTAAREAGVGCLGRFALLAGQDRAITELKPLLLQVCSNGEERMEVRAQAAMALCDLTLVFGDEVQEDKEEEKDSFAFLLSEMLCHANPAMVAVAAEIVAKLLLAGRISDPTLLAHVVVAFFDKNLADAATSVDGDSDQEAAGDVGSHVRMQQILSLFFPAFAMKSREGRETLTACIRPLLSIVDSRMATKEKGTRKSRGNGRNLSWPIAKMIEFVCSAVDVGIESREELQQAAAKTQVEESSNDEKSNNCSVESVEEKVKEQDTEEPSSTLLASIAITEFLIEQSASLTIAYLRALCKILGGAYIDVEIDDPKCLSRLKSNMDHLAMVVTDDSSIRSLENLIGVLDEYESEEDNGDDGEDDSAASLADAVEKTTLDDDNGDTMAGDDSGDGASSGSVSENAENEESQANEFTVHDSFGSIGIEPEEEGERTNPASDDEDDFFAEVGGDEDFMDVISDNDDSSFSSKENVGNRSRGKTGSGNKDDAKSAPRRKSTRRRQLANVNA
uniref:Nuclear condensin complex subunit 3 C-terminal domain-containing protein n=1 Tax=Odontella aurita TaxID=265563 RepID=A0A7S4JL97_9STRA|mmetsp:Transcript_48730/g.146838  ORF Transcript_48730/g.146838 Transcript_48730/m.146838 type:complete len:1167 (+) Transcript_48730:68-3568(+)